MKFKKYIYYIYICDSLFTAILSCAPFLLCKRGFSRGMCARQLSSLKLPQSSSEWFSQSLARHWKFISSTIDRMQAYGHWKWIITTQARCDNIKSNATHWWSEGWRRIWQEGHIPKAMFLRRCYCWTCALWSCTSKVSIAPTPPEARCENQENDALTASGKLAPLGKASRNIYSIWLINSSSKPF